jgi:hypothetical protein
MEHLLGVLNRNQIVASLARAVASLAKVVMMMMDGTVVGNMGMDHGAFLLRHRILQHGGVPNMNIRSLANLESPSRAKAVTMVDHGY